MHNIIFLSLKSDKSTFLTKYESILKRYELLFPECCINIFYLEDVVEEIKEYSDNLYNKCILYNQNVKRFDICRLFLLYKYGGLYVDFDIYPKKNFYNELLDWDFVAGYENTENVREYTKEKSLIGNAIMYSAKGGETISKILFFLDHECYDNNDAIKVAGPVFLTRILDKRIFNKEKIKIYNENIFYPLSRTAAQHLKGLNMLEGECKDSYCIHLYDGNWYNKIDGSWIKENK